MQTSKERYKKFKELEVKKYKTERDEIVNLVPNGSDSQEVMAMSEKTEKNQKSV